MANIRVKRKMKTISLIILVLFLVTSCHDEEEDGSDGSSGVGGGKNISLCGNRPLNVSGVTYEYAYSNVGDLVSIWDTDYRIIKIPFRDENGDLWHVTLPQTDVINFNVFAKAYEERDFRVCNNIKISGYGARLTEVHHSGHTTLGQDRMGSANTYRSFALHIFLSKLVIRVGFGKHVTTDSAYISAGDFDLTDDVTAAYFTTDDIMLIADMAIDHIKIEKMP